MESLPTSTSLSQQHKTLLFFNMHFVPVTMLGVSIASLVTKFPETSAQSTAQVGIVLKFVTQLTEN